jgi:hypothetical protein
MRIPRIASAAVIFLVLTGCVSKGDFEVMQGDMDELKSRYHALDKEFGELKSGTMEEAEKTLKENQRRSRHYVRKPLTCRHRWTAPRLICRSWPARWTMRCKRRKNRLKISLY